MYYLLYRERENHYTICNHEGYVLSDSSFGSTYSTTIEDACNIAKVQKDTKLFHFKLNEKWYGDTILWYYPLVTLENPRQNYPELFV